MDGVAEEFIPKQNRQLLRKLSPDRCLLETPVPFQSARRDFDSERVITVRDTKDLWNMPVIFFLIILLRSSEWLLRRNWGVYKFALVPRL